jgi:hypothetical protein
MGKCKVGILRPISQHVIKPLFRPMNGHKKASARTIAKSAEGTIFLKFLHLMSHCHDMNC